MVFKKLQQTLEGSVRADEMTRQIYSVDASIFEVEPDIVVLPKNKEDLIKTVQIARDHNVPIIPRGAATGIAGGCLGKGIVVDTSQHLNQILELNLDEGWVRCEPGVVQDDLNAFLAPYGYRLGPDTSTGNRATIGGMTATNATGAHFLKYGSMRNHVRAVEAILSSGEVKTFAQEPPTAFERRSSGYLPPSVMVGSEGTLGLFSSITVNLSPILKNPVLVIFFYQTIEESFAAVPDILKHRPVSLEALDQNVIEMGRSSPLLAGRLDWLKGHKGALLVAEFEKQAPEIAGAHLTLIDPIEQQHVWALRKSGLGLLLSRRRYSRAIAFIEDLAVPPDTLVPFITDLKNEVKREMGIYGHAGDACLHIRPYVDVRSDKEIDWMFEVMEPVTEIVRRYGGFLSGEHGDGLIRSWLNPKLFGEETYDDFVKIKETYDPLNLMNPGKIVGGEKPREFVKKVRPQNIPTFLNFEPEGGLHLAADLCNGNGACRKKSTLMCPSFQAFGEEYHSTRARAQSLRLLFNGNPLPEKGVLDVLDYCLECKGCKTECPSQVDMAKMKMEMLYQYQEKHGYFLKGKLFGNLAKWAAFGSKSPRIANLIAQHKKIRSLLGLTPHRPLPKLALKRFSKWWKAHPKQNRGQKVYLFNDSFTEFFSPEVGIAAVEVLERMGYTVEVLPFICCGRPMLSKGLLKEAKTQAASVAELIRGKEVIVLEPSCLSAIQDDYPSLIDEAFSPLSFESFLPPLVLDTPLFYHPHCHEQALSRDLPFLAHFPNLTLSQAGCCGLAGSFGYEKEHYAMSMAIGEKRLFPQIKQTDLPLVASGFSCRSQIAFATGRKVLHPAEFIKNV